MALEHVRDSNRVGIAAIGRTVESVIGVTYYLLARLCTALAKHSCLLNLNLLNPSEISPHKQGA